MFEDVGAENMFVSKLWGGRLMGSGSGVDRVWIGRFSNLAGRVELNVIDVGEYDLVRV